jgi:aspartyl/asparaginyl-tRNA synthetase
MLAGSGPNRFLSGSRLVRCARLYINGLEFARVDTTVTVREPGEGGTTQRAEFEQRDTESIFNTPKQFHNLPLTGRLVLNIDRLAMLLTGASHIRDVQFFPHSPL